MIDMRLGHLSNSDQRRIVVKELNPLLKDMGNPVNLNAFSKRISEGMKFYLLLVHVHPGYGNLSGYLSKTSTTYCHLNHLFNFLVDLGLVRKELNGRINSYYLTKKGEDYVKYLTL
jgi:hypothetical protein